jgi:thioredoxin-related protein
MMLKQTSIWILWACMFLQAQNVFSQIKTYQFSQIDSLQKVEQKKVLVFIHADWCKFCQTMKNTTFKNDSIIDKLNNQFYFIDFNAEEKNDISFNGHSFKYNPTGINTGIHALAEQLATVDNKVAYPTLCFLNVDNEIIFQHNQFINSTDLQIILSLLQ